MFLPDADTVFLLPGQEAADTAPLIDVTGNEYQGVAGVNSPLAQQPGPNPFLKSRRTSTAAYFQSLQLSAAWKNALQSTATAEIVFAPHDHVAGPDTRSLWACGNYVTAEIYGWLEYQKPAGSLFWLWTHGGAFEWVTLPWAPLDDSQWWYLSVRKTVTAGSNVNDRVNTFDCWLLPLDGSAPWNATPSVVSAGRNNPNGSGAGYHSVGSIYNGSPLYPSAWKFGGAKGSKVARTAAEMQANFLRFRDGPNASAGPAPVEQPVGIVSQVQFADTADYGSDVSTYPDISPSMGLMTGTRVLGEALLRRFSTPRGLLRFHGDYGENIRDWLSDEVTSEQLLVLKSRLEGEAEKDERVARAFVQLTYDPAAMSLKVQFELETSEGPYALTLLVTQLTIELLEAA